MNEKNKYKGSRVAKPTKLPPPIPRSLRSYQCDYYNELLEEYGRLKDALKKARQFARDSHHVTTREFAKAIGVTATQLSKWTDSLPNPEKEPDFKD
jgi:hypothetical protein